MIKKINGIRYKVRQESAVFSLNVGGLGSYEEKFAIIGEIPDYFVYIGGTLFPYNSNKVRWEGIFKPSKKIREKLKSGAYETVNGNVLYRYHPVKGSIIYRSDGKKEDFMFAKVEKLVAVG